MGVTGISLVTPDCTESLDTHSLIRQESEFGGHRAALGAGEMVQSLNTPTVLLENLTYVLGTHTCHSQLPVIANSKGADALFWLRWDLHSHAPLQRHAANNRNESFKSHKMFYTTRV